MQASTKQNLRLPTYSMTFKSRPIFKALILWLAYAATLIELCLNILWYFFTIILAYSV